MVVRSALLRRGSPSFTSEFAEKSDSSILCRVY